jgi:hypothetical protein
MSNKIILTVLAGAAISCLPALAKKPVSTQSDASFLAMAAQADMTTAHLGQDAADRGATEKVKDLGATLARDHTSDYNTLAELAGKTGETIPKSIDARTTVRLPQSTVTRASVSTMHSSYMSQKSTRNSFEHFGKKPSTARIPTSKDTRLKLCQRLNVICTTSGIC